MQTHENSSNLKRITKYVTIYFGQKICNFQKETKMLSKLFVRPIRTFEDLHAIVNPHSRHCNVRQNPRYT